MKKLDPYRTLLAVLLLFIGILPWLDPAWKHSDLFTVCGLSLVLLAGLNVLRERQKLFRTGFTIAVLFILMNGYLQFSDFPILFACSFALFFILLISVVINIITMLVSSKEIKSSFISGCIAGYLMIGICLAFFLTVVGSFETQVLTLPNAEFCFNDFLYFSLVTMTTVGFGDISPLDPVVRTAAIMTAVAGQFYMAVIVAVIVGKLMNKSES